MPVVYKSDAVARRFEFFEKVAAHKNRLALFVFFLYDVEERYSHKRVKTGSGFVENDYRRIVHKSGDERGFLLHALTHTL